jgi:hypothetical protein
VETLSLDLDVELREFTIEMLPMSYEGSFNSAFD